jgi:hypothetical protein
MPYYRAYVIGSDGKFQTAHSLDCRNDEAAIEAARQYVDGLDVEVWQATHKVARLEHKQK